MENKSVYKDQNLNTTIIVLILGALMVGFSLYLTQHYFDLKFPTGLEGNSLCNLNQFFNCDKTTYSPVSNIFGVPISLFGAIIGGLTLIGLIFKNEDYERTIYFSLGINFVGCVALFCYSLFVLKGLCPFCTLYYIVSGITLYLFFKKSTSLKPAVGYLATFAAITLALSGIVKINIEDKAKAQTDVISGVLKEYFSLPNLGSPSVDSPYKIASVANAPIKMVIFSDFECPACRALSQMVPQIASHYQGKIDIQYFFYPLDNSCNPSMERPLHHYACQAAYAASCMPLNEFAKVHDDIFQNQEKFEAGFIEEFIRKNNLGKCVTDPKTKEKVVSIIKAADPFNIRSTPTFLINGVKIEGVISIDQMNAIFDEILKRAGK